MNLRMTPLLLGALFLLSLGRIQAEETFTPYHEGNVPQNVEALWKDYDARKEALEVQVIKEWKGEGVVSRYVTFKVGTFKGSDARIAAYYCFPENGKRNPAFVWSHGGGQRAERARGVYFAKQGFATVDINWLGRPMEEGIDVHTDWGKVDPTQGPQFYGKALRKHWKRNLQPDEHSLDPVVSPRNSNWFLLAVAGRRAITFLEQQPEVDADRIGFAGFSMGGMVTGLTSIDPRLKAVVPFVGGTGFKYVDFPGLPGSSDRVHFQNLDLQANTMDLKSYWPLVRCPVLFISSSNDFHSAIDRIYQSMALLPHTDWRVSTNIHENHGPGPEQWVLLNHWFKTYLGGGKQDLPPTPPSHIKVVGGTAHFVVTPKDLDRIVETEIYYSHDPNCRTRFWARAEARQGRGQWMAELPVKENLPLYAMALCRYRLPAEEELQNGRTETFVLNSLEHVVMPEDLDLEKLHAAREAVSIVEDFRHGLQDWSSRNPTSIKTYKFQNPALDRGDNKKLRVRLDPKGKKIALVLSTGSRFMPRSHAQDAFRLVKTFEGEGVQEVLIAREAFKGKEGETLHWNRIATFSVSLKDMDANQQLNLLEGEGTELLQELALVD